MQRKTILTAFTTVACLCALSAPALARTISAASGAPTIGTSSDHFNTPNGSVYNASSTNRGWTIPLSFDFAGSRTISVHGRVNSNASMTCQAVAVNANGTLASSSLSVPFPANGTYTSISLSLSSVPGGSMGSVTCMISGVGRSILLGVDYAP